LSSSHDQERRELEARAENLEAQVADQDSHAQRLNSYIAARDVEIEHLQQRHNDLNASVDALKGANDTMKIKHAAEMEGMETKGRRDLNLIAAQEQALAQHRDAAQVCCRQSSLRTG
jgi:uncharacterized coiled-coil protein SlyX